MEKPLVQIGKFAGMAEKGIYYLEGASPININGKSILTPKQSVDNYISEDDTDYAKVNKAIIDRWSFSALHYIKEKAWKMVRS